MSDITHEAIDAAMAVFWDECDLPYAAQIRDFTDAQVEAGEFREAQLEADARNRVFLRRVIAAYNDYAVANSR